MKTAYPVIIRKGNKYHIASIPDCQVDTQGKDIVDAIEMARDAISIWCVAEEDAGRELPKPTELSSYKNEADCIVTLVDVDLGAYRRKTSNHTVRKNLTIPSWLNEMAEQADLNISGVLQEALKQKLGVTAPR